jgi:hypothetical protein
MREGNILNGNFIHFNTNLVDFILINYGLNKYFFIKVVQRLEFFKKTESLLNINKK